MTAGTIWAHNRSRYGHIKSRNGCLTCKKRRVKCGEEKPKCRRCANTGRECSYEVVNGHDYRSWSRDSSSQSPPLLMAESYPSEILDCSFELRALEFFFERGMPIFPRAMDNRFWKSCVLQACHTEPVIWDAVIALSTLFEHPQYSDDPVRGLRGAPRLHPKAPVKDKSHQQALIWYNRSLSKLRSSLDNGTANQTVVLISCILYICIELLQDNVNEVLQLYHRGASLIKKSNASMLEEFVASIFYHISGLAIVMNYISPSMAPTPDLRAPDDFSNLDEAEPALFRFLPRFVAYRNISESEVALLSPEHDAKYRSVILEAQRNLATTELDRWLQKFNSLGISFEGDTSPAEKFAIAKILQAHAVLRTGVATSNMSEMVNDDIVDIYEDILNYGRYGIAATRYPDGTQPPFSLEASIALPLYCCATKCRDYRIRHEALDLLWEAPQVQGLCKSAHHAVMASKMISIEEEGLELVDRGDGQGPTMFVPESHRIVDALVTSIERKHGGPQWALKYTRRVPCEDGVGYRLVEEISPFDFSEKLPA